MSEKHKPSLPESEWEGFSIMIINATALAQAGQYAAAFKWLNRWLETLENYSGTSSQKRQTLYCMAYCGIKLERYKAAQSCVDRLSDFGDQGESLDALRAALPAETAGNGTSAPVAEIIDFNDFLVLVNKDVAGESIPFRERRSAPAGEQPGRSPGRSGRRYNRRTPS